MENTLELKLIRHTLENSLLFLFGFVFFYGGKKDFDPLPTQMVKSRTTANVSSEIAFSQLSQQIKVQESGHMCTLAVRPQKQESHNPLFHYLALDVASGVDWRLNFFSSVTCSLKAYTKKAVRHGGQLIVTTFCLF